MKISAKIFVLMWWALIVIKGLALGGCAEDFESFNVVSKLRVLAIKAEPPELLPGQSTQLAALVYEPDGDDLSYEWSWCPLSTGAATGFDCVISEEDLDEIADQIFPGAGDLFPGFGLGNEATVTFEHSIDPVILQGFCEAILNGGAPSFVTLPDCEKELVATVKLVVSGGGETVTAVKEVALKMEQDAPVNVNPSIGEIEARLNGEEQRFSLEAGQPTEMQQNKRHELFAEVPSESTEPYTPDPTEETPDPEETTESLFMTWFVTGGETDFKRTTYLPDEIGLDELGENAWKTPRREDTEGGDATLFLVLQDERGGVAWTERVLRILEY